MAQPYVGEIRMFAGNFAPAGWMLCEGQLMSIAENEVLFQLIGTTYGGDGQSTFALPDLRGRLPLHQNPPGGFLMATSGGVEQVTLTVNQIPAHTHPVLANSGSGGASSPQNNLLATTVGDIYSGVTGNQVNMSPQAVSSTGGSQPHNNFQPYLCVNFIISLFGLFPSQS